MKHTISASKKIAVLTGVAMLVSGAGIVSANADTTAPQSLPINFFEGDQNPAHNPLSFLRFNQPGTLTGVTFNLDSTFSFTGLTSVSASVTVNGNSIFSTNTVGPTFSPPAVTLPFDPFFTGAGTFPATLFIDTDCGGSFCLGGWIGNLSVTYTFNPPGSVVPLPAALPLFATGLGALGLLGWRRKKKAAALAA